MSEIDKRLKSAARRATFQRNYRRARDRVLVKLAQAYPDQYRQLLEEERARDEAEGKSWLDISGRTKRSMGSPSTSNRNSSVPKQHTNADKGEARHNGGEA